MKTTRTLEYVIAQAINAKGTNHIAAHSATLPAGSTHSHEGVTLWLAVRHAGSDAAALWAVEQEGQVSFLLFSHGLAAVRFDSAHALDQWRNKIGHLAELSVCDVSAGMLADAFLNLPFWDKEL